jgi:hypothetical protein
MLSQLYPVVYAPSHPPVAQHLVALNVPSRWCFPLVSKGMKMLTQALCWVVHCVCDTSCLAMFTELYWLINDYYH